MMKDTRYYRKTVTVPIVGRVIPIVADEYVDPEFGTGMVKITLLMIQMTLK